MREFEPNGRFHREFWWILTSWPLKSVTVACSGNPDFLDDQSLIFVSPWSPCNLLSISAKFKFRTSATFFSLIFRLFFPTKSTILGKFYKNSTQIFEKFKIFIRFGIFDKFQQTKQIPDFFFDNCNMIKTRKRPIFLNFLLISACFLNENVLSLHFVSVVGGQNRVYTFLREISQGFRIWSQIWQFRIFSEILNFFRIFFSNFSRFFF